MSLTRVAKHLVIWGIHVSPSQGRDEFGKRGLDEKGQDYQKIFISGGREERKEHQKAIEF